MHASVLTEPYLTIWIALALCAGALLLLKSARPVFRRFESLLARIAHHQNASLALLFFAVIAVRLALLPFLPAPNPGIHDEFSYLLMADTFAHARLANPPHPMWRSFETFHVLWHPTYASKYPPAQGAVLALGQVLGHPWIGVLFSTAAMCAAIVWSLRPFLPPRWALLAGLLAFLRLGIASYWMNSYWGGSVAAIGGALVLGAVGRILRRPLSITSPVLFATGLAILANSRPYEGLVYGIPAGLALLPWLTGKTRYSGAWRDRALRAVLPMAALLAANSVFMGYYNWRVTGSPLLFPYVLETQNNDRSALFVWQRAKPPGQYDNRELETYYNQWERAHYDRTWKDFGKITLEKWRLCSKTFLGPGLMLVFPWFFFVWRDRRFRIPLTLLAAALLGFVVSAWSNPHYLAPATCVIYGLAAQAMRHLRTITPRRRIAGVLLQRAAILILIIDASASVAKRASDRLSWGGWGLSARADVQRELEQTPGEHLVIVRYGAGHSVHEEWVYNGADIDSQKVIWARELDAAQNARLLAYYKGRKAWLLRPDENDSEVERYSVAGGAPDHR